MITVIEQKFLERVPSLLQDIAKSAAAIAENVKPVQKVWVLHRECVIDYELSSREIKIFRSEEAARKEFKEKAKHDRKYCCTSEWEVGTDDEDNFDAYEDGRYAQNHIMIELKETVIN